MEKLAVSSQYYSLVTGEIEKAMEVLEVWKRIYPRDYRPANQLYLAYNGMGQFEKAVEEVQEALRREPNNSFPRGNLGTAFLNLNRFDEAKAVLEKAIEQKIIPRGDPRLHQIAFVQGDAAAMQREVEAAKGKPAELGIRFSQAAIAGFLGQLNKTRELSREASEMAKRMGLRQNTVDALADQAQREALVGNDTEARRLADEALALDQTRETRMAAAGILALAGALAQAEKLAATVASEVSTATFLNAVDLPRIRAATELRRGAPAKAIEHLRSAAPYERASHLSIYLRGQAHLKAGSGAEAAAEFQKIIANRGVSRVNVLYPLAHVGLGRASVLIGDTAKARKAYQDFFAFWKDADPDVPVLIEAKREYAALK